MYEKPNLADLRRAAQQLGMNPSEDYLRAVDEITAPLSAAYAALDAMPDELPRGEISARRPFIARMAKRIVTAPGM